MRRSCKILICVMLLALLAGCRQSRAPKEEESNLYVIGFSQLGSESDWRLANTQSMIDTFTNEKGYELLVENALQQQDNQLAAIRRFILEEVDMIIVAPTTEEGWELILTEAKEANIPVIVMDRSVNVWNRDLYLTNVGSDFLNEGKLAIDWMEQQNFKNDGETVKIVHLQGTYGATSQLLRTRALEKAVSAHDEWEIVGQLDGDFTEARGYEVMQQFLYRNKDVDVIYSENDNMTFGAIRALDEAGLTYGPEGKVKIVTFDATKKALQLCLDGKIDVCVECNPMHGPLIERLISEYRNGETIPKSVYIDETVYTRDTLTQEIVDARQY